jgi:hypothetical protein
VEVGGWFSPVYGMLPAIALLLAFCATADVWGSHHMRRHVLPIDLINWFRTIMERMFKVFAILSLKGEDSL